MQHAATQNVDNSLDQLMTVYFVSHTCAHAASSYGREFFIAIPSALSFGLVPQLVIGTSASNASYSVETAAGVIREGAVHFDSPVSVTFSFTDISVMGSDYADRQKGIHVRATGVEPIFVLVTTIQSAGFGDYLAYPCQGFETDNYEYYAVSTTSTSRGFSSQVVLVACENQTEVTVTPTETISLPLDTQDPESRLISIIAGDSHTVTINQMQTLLISTMGADLTGTKVVSNKPLTVISGHECGNVPESFRFCEQLAVQVPPTLTWGSEFLLAPFIGRTTGQFYKVVASSNDTTIIYKCGSSNSLATVLVNPGNSYLFQTESSDYCYMYSNKPVFVVQMATGGFILGGLGDSLGDPVMAIVPPIQQHVSSARVLSLRTLDFESHGISVTVAREHFRGLDILYDGLPLNCIWKEIVDMNDCIVGFGCTMDVTSGSHTVSHAAEGGLLSVMAYGFDSSPLRGYAYTAGLNIQLRDNQTGPDTPVVEFPERVRYFDLEGFPGVTELKREKDANSEPINIPRGILFGDHIVTRAYVSENGVISFDAQWKYAHPSRFPTDYFYTRNAYVVAPFWSDNDIRKEGVVRYVAFEKGMSAEGDELLREASAFVQGRRGDDDERDEFVGKWMLVAQWDHVHPDPHGADHHMGIPEALLERTNTYQAVIITDGVFSSILFTYTCGDLEWSTTGNRPAVVGYNAGGTYFENHRSSGFDTVGNDVSCVTVLRRSKRQVDIVNTVGMEIDIDEPLMQSTSECRRRNRTDVAVIADNLLVNLVLPCPCTYGQAKLDPRFIKDANFRNTSGTTCYIQRFPALGYSHTGPITYGQQCCYDVNSGALHTTPPNAGTLLVYDPSDIQDPPNIQDPPHDKVFYESCCLGEGLECNLFYSRRQPQGARSAQYSPPACCAWGITDPHYRSITQHFFDYHVEGEFLLMEIGPERSQLQGFLKRLGPYNCSWHISFAFGEPGSFAYQMANPNNSQFVLLKTQGKGTENGSLDITNNVSNVGDTYRDTTNRVHITRIGSEILQIIFKSGLFFWLRWRELYDFKFGNAEIVKILEQYAAVNQSRGIMGSTTWSDCELPIFVLNN